MRYCVRRAALPPLLDAADTARWTAAEVLAVDQFHPRSSAHRPTTRVRALHDDDNVYFKVDVQDRFVRCVHTQFQNPVSRDSCVEFFLQPRPNAGYFNFEINCGGTLLVYYIESPRRATPGPFEKFTILTEDDATLIQIATTLPERVDPERTEPTAWSIVAAVRRSLFEKYVGSLGSLGGKQWRGNFHKCGNQTSHPHWAAWSDIGQVLSFHQPERFGVIDFE